MSCLWKDLCHNIAISLKISSRQGFGVAIADFVTYGRPRSVEGQTMGILDLFRKHKDEVQRAMLLVCAVDNRFDDLLKEDSEI